MDAGSCRLVVVTAADRAAATLRHGETNPSTRHRRAPPLSGEALREVSPNGFLRRGGILHHSLREEFPSFYGRKQRVVANPPQVSISCLFRHDQRALRSPFGNLRPIAPQLYENQRWQVAAALSAAVTTRKPIGDAPNSHGCASPKKRASLFPATLRERGSGGEALLLEKRPLPQNLPNVNLFVRGCGGECFSIEKHSPPHIFSFPSFFRTKFLKSCERYGISRGSVV